MNVSKLLVNNTKNLSSDYNLCRALLRATAGATEIVGTWGFFSRLLPCSFRACETLGLERGIRREIFVATSEMVAPPPVRIGLMFLKIYTLIKDETD